LAARNSSSITSSSRARSQSRHVRGQPRADVALLGEPDALRVRVELLDLGKQLAEVGAQAVGVAGVVATSSASRRRSPLIAAPRRVLTPGARRASSWSSVTGAPE